MSATKFFICTFKLTKLKIFFLKIKFLQVHFKIPKYNWGASSKHFQQRMFFKRNLLYLFLFSTQRSKSFKNPQFCIWGKKPCFDHSTSLTQTPHILGKVQIGCYIAKCINCSYVKTEELSPKINGMGRGMVGMQKRKRLMLIRIVNDLGDLGGSVE